MKNFTILPQTPQLIALFTIIRNKDTRRNEFNHAADRIIRLLIEEALNLLPISKKTITTPTGNTFTGVEFMDKLCAVPIIRAGESMEKEEPLYRKIGRFFVSFVR